MKKIKNLLIFTILLLSTLLLTSCKKEGPLESFNLYKDSWEKQDYKSMYEMLSEESKSYISMEDFISRYGTIYEGIGARNIKIEEIDGKSNEGSISFSLSMDTTAGLLTLENYKAELIKEKLNKKTAWTINWDESLIFPQMDREDKVRITTTKAKRGQIYDRFGKGLAVNGKRNSLGIHPSKFDTSNIPLLASLLDIDKEFIEGKLEKNKNPEHFVPIAKLPLESEDLLAKSLEIEGVIYYQVDERVYPGGEALGSTIGYIRPITAEELDKHKDGIYDSTSLVGKFGLEEVFEETLRPIDGKSIYISKIKDGEEVERISLIESIAKDGKDLNTTIDTGLQQKIYEEMDGNTGASVAVNPKTGQVLAMVSSPSFDSNFYTSYISNSQREEWNKMDTNVFENKFNKAYSPGSTFKLLTSAIALEENKINPLEKINIGSQGWQKDSSWGNYKINRVNNNISKVDLKDAVVFSDNIYFAMSALKIGGNSFIEGAKKFGFMEDIPIEYPMANSQIINSKSFDNEILLADTGYGQGQVLMSPLHLSLVYSSLVNKGDIMRPTLELEREASIWKKGAISDKNINILLPIFTDVIAKKDGTGHDAKLDGIVLAGKTGTAELKSSQEAQGKENGWFVAMDVDKPSIVISMLIENVESRGGSKFVVSKVRNVLEYYRKIN